MVRKQLILILILFVPFFTTQLWGSPQLVQVSDDVEWTPGVQSFIGNEASGTYRIIELPEKTTAGNMLTALIEQDSGGTPPTLTLQPDNASAVNGWTATAIQTFTPVNAMGSCTANGRFIYLYYLPNVQAGFHAIKVAFHATNITGGGPVVAEWANVATTSPLDGFVCSASQGGTSAFTFNAGASAFTPTQGNELAIESAWDAYRDLPREGGVGVFYTAASGWTKFHDSAFWATGGQWTVLPSTPAAINPSFTTDSPSGTRGALRIAAFFKTAQAGGVPSGIRVIHKKNLSLNSSGGNNFGPFFEFTNPHIYFPCTGGNLMAADYAGPNVDLTNVTDTAGNTWSRNAATNTCSTGTGGTACVSTWSTKSGATPNQTQRVDLTLSGLGADTAHLYCIAGAAASPFDKAVTKVDGNIAALISVTPSATNTNGLVLVTGSQNTSTTTGFGGPSGASYQGCFESTELPTNTDGGGCAANNTWGLFHTPDASAESWTAVTSNGGGLSGNAAEADVYKAAAGGSQPSPPTNLTSTVQ